MSRAMEAKTVLGSEARELQWYPPWRTTVGALLVIHHLFLQLYLLRRNHLGNRIQMQIFGRAHGHSDSPVNMVVWSFQEKRRLQIMAALGRFIIDKREAVKVGDLDKNVESRPVVKPNFTTDFPEAVVREGAGGLTVRREEEGMLRTIIDATGVGDN